jgi:hypothetical protein
VTDCSGEVNFKNNNALASSLCSSPLQFSFHMAAATVMMLDEVSLLTGCYSSSCHLPHFDDIEA